MTSVAFYTVGLKAMKDRLLLNFASLRIEQPPTTAKIGTVAQAS
jgi:hypothetical protein